jgi:hypothetical protein
MTKRKFSLIVIFMLLLAALIVWGRNIIKER